MQDWLPVLKKIPVLIPIFCLDKSHGFCFMIKTTVLEQIGLLDEKAFPQGYGEENDLCLRVSEAGFKLAIADNCYVFHAKSKSFGSERKEALSKAGHQKLIEKHGELFHNKLEKTKTNPSLNQIRAQLNSYIQTIVQDTSPYDLKILFLLPVKGGGGGALPRARLRQHGHVQAAWHDQSRGGRKHYEPHRV